MKIYLAGGGWDKIWEGDKFYDFYHLKSFYGLKEKETKSLHKYKGFMLDSGAFTLFSGKNINLEEYVDKYIDFIKKHKIEQFFELDIFQVIGKEKTDLINNKIERVVGKQTIPVFHYFLGIDYYKQLCNEYNQIAISASGMYASKWTRQYPNKLRKLIDYAHNKNVKVHGLGYTPLGKLDKMPFDSVDSTAWLSGNRFGMIYEWLGNEMRKINKREGKRLTEYDIIVRHNFYEWIKFSNYAEQNL
jgi:hypothetical protein